MTTDTGIDAQIALHYCQGGSDKVWAGAVIGSEFHSRWGRRGSALAVGLKDLGSPEKAKKELDKKVKEKTSEGYVEIPFDNSGYGVPSFGAGNYVSLMAAAAPKAVKHVSCHVMPLTRAELAAAIASPHYGLSEKVNGHRRLVEYNPATGAMTGYNRKGQEIAGGVPESCKPLARFGRQFVIDGEAMLDEPVVGRFVAFDLLELDGVNLRNQPYHLRMRSLARLLDQSEHVAVTQYVGYLNASWATDGCLVLMKAETDPVGKQALADQVERRGGEGLIVRDLAGVYQTGDTKYVRKYKFRAEIDCEILYVKPGIGTGSVGLGLTRPSDNAIIELGTARGGLTDPDMRKLGEMIAAGQRPVIKVEYLPIRTVGISPVEPTLYMKDLRTDKTAQECTTDQFGPEKQLMVEAAKPWKRLL
jgi:ATP-dependent DNA ligase/predicted DNA-binding WGR domain protein